MAAGGVPACGSSHQRLLPRLPAKPLSQQSEKEHQMNRYKRHTNDDDAFDERGLLRDRKRYRAGPVTMMDSRTDKA
jgi:hypothetical protein